jgi:hypothetical protein
MLLSLLIVLTLGLGLALFVWAMFAALPVVDRIVTRSFWCRFRYRNVSAQFHCDPWSGRPVGVTHCTAFEPPEAITCDKGCLRLRKLDPFRDSETDGEPATEEILVEPRWITANAERAEGEQLLTELRRW